MPGDIEQHTAPGVARVVGDRDVGERDPCGCRGAAKSLWSGELAQRLDGAVCAVAAASLYDDAPLVDLQAVAGGGEGGVEVEGDCCGPEIGTSDLEAEVDPEGGLGRRAPLARCEAQVGVGADRGTVVDDERGGRWAWRELDEDGRGDKTVRR